MLNGCGSSGGDGRFSKVSLLDRSFIDAIVFKFDRTKISLQGEFEVVVLNVTWPLDGRHDLKDLSDCRGTVLTSRGLLENGLVGFGAPSEI